MSPTENRRPVKKPATLRNCVMSSAVTACAFLGVFSYMMFTGNLQRGVPYDVVKAAEESVKHAALESDERDMAAAFQYGKR